MYNDITTLLGELVGDLYNVLRACSSQELGMTHGRS